MFCRKGFRRIVGGARPLSTGYTVIEFIVALTLVAILVALAAPSLQQFIADNQLVSANNTIVSGLNLARSTAITTGDDTTICPSSDGVSCAEDTWDKGWIVFSDADGDGSADLGEILRVVTIESEVNNSGFGDSIVFQPDGTTSMGSDATIINCREQGSTGENCANVTINQFGLIEAEKHRTESDSPGGEEPTS